MIRLIIGQAGSGKTQRIMEEIARRAAAGARTLTLLVPEQYSHDAERQLLQIAGDSLSLHGEVLSFKRLALRVAEELGDTRRFIDSGGALLALYQAIRSVSGRLMLYGGSLRRAQFLSALQKTITQLRNNGVTPEMLYAAAHSGSVLSNKLHDLALIMDAYEAQLSAAGEYDTKSALLSLSENVAKSAYAGGAMWFDGFTDFTAPETEVVAGLIRTGAELTFCLTAPALEADGEAFRLTCECANALIMLAAECGEACEIEYVDGGVSRPPELLYMQDALFGDCASSYDGDCGAIDIYTAPDTATECATAAALVSELVRGGMRYRDIAVMYHGDSSYSRLCESVFERFDIPVFRSGRDDILDKPPIKLITSALDLISSGWRYENVFAYLKTGLAGIQQERLDELENFVLRRNIRGAWWSREQPWQDAPPGIDETRREVARPMLTLADAMRRAKTGGEILRALYAFLESISLPNTLAERAYELREAERERLADEYFQLWDIIVSALDRMYTAVGDSELALTEFSQMLTALFSCYDVGVIPVALDRVTIGDMSMNRRRSVRALIVLGASEGNMPAVQAQTGVLSDTELGELALKLGLSNADTPERRVYREFSVIYSALTMPSERLFVIYPDKPGTPPSFIVTRFSDIFGISPRALTKDRLIPPSERRALETARENIPLDRGALSPAVASALYGQTMRLSATRVELFSRCKFAFFLQNGLYASPREPERFDAPEQGNFTHFVLERTAAAVKEAGGFRRATDGDVLSLTRSFTAEYIRENYPDFEERSERFKYLLRRLSSDTENVSLDLARELRRSDFEPLYFEARFTARLPDAGLEITGIIDRIDSWTRGGARYLRVADYKTGRASFSMSDIYYGLGMQMPLYLFAIGQEDALAIPAGALYTPARDEFFTAKRNMPDENIASELSKKLRRSGILLAEPEVIDAMENDETKLYLPVSRSSGGYSGENLLTLTQLSRLSRHVEQTLAKTARELRGGMIDANPYLKNEREHSCRFCKFGAVCGFGTLAGDEARRLRTLRGDSFWNALGEVDDNGGL